jgi:hypothetical protein
MAYVFLVIDVRTAAARIVMPQDNAILLLVVVYVCV